MLGASYGEAVPRIRRYCDCHADVKRPNHRGAVAGAGGRMDSLAEKKQVALDESGAFTTAPHSSGLRSRA